MSFERMHCDRPHPGGFTLPDVPRPTPALLSANMSFNVGAILVVEGLGEGSLDGGNWPARLLGHLESLPRPGHCQDLGRRVPDGAG